MVFDIRGVDDVKLGKISLRAKLLNIPSCGWYFEVFEPPRSWEKKKGRDHFSCPNRGVCSNALPFYMSYIL